MYQTETFCRECGTAMAEGFDQHWLICPRCSRISRDFKPPDFHPTGDWDLPDVDGVELAMSLCSASMTEHADE